MPHSTDSDSIMSDTQTSASIISANHFPKTIGTAITVPAEPTDPQPSPPLTGFSFDDINGASARPVQPVVKDDLLVERKEITRPIEHGAPGERKQSCVSTASDRDKSRRRTQYFEDSFAYKDGMTGSARDRVMKDSPVIADLRTNVIVKDEYSLVTDLSAALSTRYQRPENSIMVTVNHSACLMLGGSFEPAYILTISALPAHVAPTTNKRNAALIQTCMTDILEVSSDRGILKFQSIPEENLATRGKTMLSEVEHLEKDTGEDNNPRKSIIKSSRKSFIGGKSKTRLSLESKSTKSLHSGQISPPLPSPSTFESPAMNMRKDSVAPNMRKDSVVPNMRKDSVAPNMRKDSVAARVDSGAGADMGMYIAPTAQKSMPKLPEYGHSLTPPPIPSSSPQPKISKRKSFVSIFKR